MNQNPYETTAASASDTMKLRSVRGMLAWSAFFAFSAYPPVSSGLQLLNHELGLFPVAYGIYDIEIAGVGLSNRSFTVSSFLAGALLLAIALVLALRARRNYKYNTSIRLAHATDAV